MPLYEYDCSSCGRIEVMQKFDDKPLTTCPECKEKGKKSSVKKVLSASAFHLKGSGWYKTDYASSSGSAGSKKKSSGDSSSSTDSSGGDSKSDSSSSSDKPASLKTAGSCGSGCGCH